MLNNLPIIMQVPPNYYQKGIKSNYFQRMWHTKKLRNVSDLIALYKKTPATLLDVGCASGWFVFQLHKLLPKATCYGVDIYKEAIVYGKKKYPSLRLRQADAAHLPYKGNFFDVVVCTEVLEHVDNPKDVLREMKRVLKKGGVAIIELDSGSYLFSIVWYLWKKFNGKVWNDAHLHSFTPKRLEAYIKSVGFTIQEKKLFNWHMAMVFAVKK